MGLLAGWFDVAAAGRAGSGRRQLGAAVQGLEYRIHRQGRILIIADTSAMLQRIVSQLGASPAPTGAAYAARYLHSRELGPFTRMMTQIDAAASDSGEGPRFFSQNVASLGNVLAHVESSAITVHDDGARVTQQMFYRLRQ